MLHLTTLFVTLVITLVATTAPAQSWAGRHPAPSSAAAAVAYDSGRQRLVVYSGNSRVQTGSLPASGLWEWDGASWHRCETPPFPLRSGVRMAYDSARRRTVLFGGRQASPLRGLPTDVWEWDGARWTRHVPATAPPGTEGHAMAYDSKRERVVLFGVGSSALWEWDGSAWTPRSAAAAPPRAVFHGMAYDSARDRIVMFGGSLGSDTWEWDGSGWHQLTTALAPARSSVAMAYDQGRGRTVLYGGDLFPSPRRETWEWDGVRWRQAAPASLPTAAVRTAMAYDSARGEVMLFSGSGASFTLTDELWAWDGGDWSVVEAAPPEPRTFAAMAYDESRSRAVLFGGSLPVFQIGAATSTPMGAGTWEWDGARWTLAPTTAAPAGRFRHNAVYDQARQRVVVYGGATTMWAVRFPWSHSRPLGPFLDDTWTWDGTTWVEQQPAERPPARHTAAMAYDSSAERTLLFGGDGGFLRNDTWEWDGTQWRERQPALRPPPRRASAMAYDPGRDRIVLFGGYTAASVVSDDTWEWDGTQWEQRFPPVRPRARRLHSMSYDPNLGAVVLHGGNQGAFGWPEFNYTLSDTWAWDGATWTHLPASPNAPARNGHAWATDPSGVHIVFGGEEQFGSYLQWGWPTDETWLFSAGPTLAAATAVGQGCPGSQGVPALRSFGLPIVGRSFSLDVTSARPRAAGAMLLTAGSASVALAGGCTLLVDVSTPSAVVPIFTNAAGFVSLPIPLPAIAPAAGIAFRGQAGILDPVGTFFGVAFTDGQDLRLGR
ncbi:MAG: kelch repeat-containing protein [Planctomycetota bacterium]